MSKSHHRDPKIVRSYRAVYQYCEICKMNPVEIHHIKTRGAGGTDEVFNLIALCHEHHTEVHKTGVKTFAIKYGLEYRFSHVLKGKTK
jgi:predicted restriction endonuclease